MSYTHHNFNCSIDRQKLGKKTVVSTFETKITKMHISTRSSKFKVFSFIATMQTIEIDDIWIEWCLVIGKTTNTNVKPFVKIQSEMQMHVYTFVCVAIELSKRKLFSNRPTNGIYHFIWCHHVWRWFTARILHSPMITYFIYVCTYDTKLWFLSCQCRCYHR